MRTLNSLLPAPYVPEHRQKNFVLDNAIDISHFHILLGDLNWGNMYSLNNY